MHAFATVNLDIVLLKLISHLLSRVNSLRIMYKNVLYFLSDKIFENFGKGHIILMHVWKMVLNWDIGVYWMILREAFI